jgi:hypothetical protein
MADASDTTKKKQAKTIYINQLNAFVAQNSQNGVLSTCTTAPTSSVTAVFQSFENKYAFFSGKDNCADCSCPKTGYSER